VSEGWENREERILNVSVLNVRFWGGEYREELILNIIGFIVNVWGGEYRMELKLNVTVFVVRVWEKGIKGGTDTECYCVCCEGLGSGIEGGIYTE
jgi:hypothetical protein